MGLPLQQTNLDFHRVYHYNDNIRVVTFIVIINNLFVNCLGEIMIVWFLFGAMCMLVLLLLWAYFLLAKLDSAAKSAWNKLDNKIKNRAELLPSLSLTAATLSELDRDEIQQKLSALTQPSASLQERIQKENEITLTLKQIFTAAMKHEEIQKEEHFEHLQNSIIHAERNVRRAKNTYNNAARKFNTISTIIPLNLIVKIFEMHPYEYFEFDPSLSGSKKSS